jgi:hypothetical protein
MKIRDGEWENRSLNTRVISLGENDGKMDATKAWGAAAAGSDRSSLALREERRRRARPRDGASELTGPAALSPNLVHPSPAAAEPPSSKPDCRASLGWRPRAFPCFKKKKLPVGCFWKLVISGSFFFFSFSFFGVGWRGPKGFFFWVRYGVV